MKHIIKSIKENGLTGKAVGEIIDLHTNDHERMKESYGRYKADTEVVPIFKRNLTALREDFETGGNVRKLDNTVNNKLNNAFDAEIVDTRTGYHHGVPITYALDEEESNNSLSDWLTNFTLRNNIDDQDAEFGKMAAICGYAARLAYVDTEGDLRIKNLNPYNVAFLGENMTEPKYSVYYYIEQNKDETNQTIHAEFYDSERFYIFEGDTTDNLREVHSQPHLFDYNPLFGAPNNEELLGDAERVRSLIDAYNITISDASSEISQTRLAYLVLRGMGMDEEDIQNTQKSGVFELFDEKMDIKYLTKDVNNQMIEDVLNRLEKNIMRFSKSVNFNSDEFNGNVPVIGMHLKLMALENKCMTFERKMSAALRYQFKVLLSGLSKKMNISKDTYLNVYFTFGRNLPINKLEEAQLLALLNGQVSDLTRYEQSSIVSDPKWEIEQRDKEMLVLGGAEDELRTD